MPSLELRNIFKSYGPTKVVHDLDLSIQDKEFVVLVGPSGCGKSTTLRMIAGLEEITSGDLMISEKLMNNVSPVDRGVAMVFQDYALYPHMTVFENMAFGLRLKNVPKDEIKKRVEQTAEMLDLTKYLNRKPAALSGGQRQRVAMGRAVVKRAEIFLFDEPLSNLDAKLRSKMRLEIKQFHKKFNTTSVYVTHDQLEAMTLADRLVVMKNGFIEQAGTPMEVYDKPKNVFVATFIGSPSMNILPFAVNWNGDKCTLTADMEGFNVEVPAERAESLRGVKKIELGIRPTDVVLQNEGPCVEATVEMVELLGKNAYLTIKAGLYDITVDVEGHDCPKEGEKVCFKFDYSKAHFFDFETKENLEF